MTNFFKSESDRNLWIKLNGEFINEFQMKVNRQQSDILGCIQVSKNQLEYDEENGKLRMTFEQLLSFSYEQYENHLHENHEKWCNVFKKLKKEEILKKYGWNPKFSQN